MKNVTDRVLRNPLTSLLGIAFAVVGIWVLQWTSELSEASRVFLAILCFAIAMTGLGWRDKAFIKVLELFKSKTNILLFFSLFTFLMTGCVTNRQILEELRAFKASQDSINNANQIILYENQKSTIDSDYQSISDPELFERIKRLTSPKPPIKSKDKY